MYKHHGWAFPPKVEGAPTIRYYRLERFLDLLSTSSLYFSRLSQFNDRWDGTLPRITVALPKDGFTNRPRNPGDKLTDFEMLIRENNRINKYCTYASCWYLHKYESDAMWQLYAKDGVAVNSTFARLRDSFQVASADVFIGKMIYFDFDTTQPPTYGNTLAAAFFKRIEYEHERELRAVIINAPAEWTHGDLTDELIVKQPLGLEVPVELDTLIESVTLSPRCPERLQNQITQALQSVGLRKPVRRSRLDDVPELI